MSVKVSCQECQKNNHRTCEDKNNLIKRLNVIEGQIRGIRKMVESDRFCEEILVQTSAVEHSLRSLGNSILKNHLKTCVLQDIKCGKYESIDEWVSLFDKLNK